MPRPRTRPAVDAADLLEEAWTRPDPWTFFGAVAKAARKSSHKAQIWQLMLALEGLSDRLATESPTKSSSFSLH